MIFIYQGRPGQGKTLYAVCLMRWFLFWGYPVYSNIYLRFKVGSRLAQFYTYVPPSDVLSTLMTLSKTKISSNKNIKVFIDEVQLYFNSRRWDTLPIAIQGFLQQHRKRGVDVYGFCQSVKRADIVMRELVGVFYDIRKIFVFSLPYVRIPLGLILIREYDPDYIDERKDKWEQFGWTIFGFKFIFPTSFNLYNTTEEQSLPTLCKSCTEANRKKLKCDICPVEF